MKRIYLKASKFLTPTESRCVIYLFTIMILASVVFLGGCAGKVKVKIGSEYKCTVCGRVYERFVYTAEKPAGEAATVRLQEMEGICETCKRRYTKEGLRTSEFAAAVVVVLRERPYRRLKVRQCFSLKLTFWVLNLTDRELKAVKVRAILPPQIQQPPVASEAEIRAMEQYEGPESIAVKMARYGGRRIVAAYKAISSGADLGTILPDELKEFSAEIMVSEKVKPGERIFIKGIITVGNKSFIIPKPVELEITF